MESDSHNLDLMVEKIYSPTYPFIASQITEKFGIKKGICIDVGTGPAPLAIAIAKITALKIYAMDISNKMFQIAEQNIASECFEDMIIPIKGDVSNMPFEDDFAELIISRGSMFFWKDLTSAFREIYRVLKPGGAGYIGGGFGSASLKKKVKKQFQTPGYGSYKSPPKIDADALKIAVMNAGINDFTLIDDESGLWVLFKKIT